jgi:short-subunit dehydrogenase
MEVNFFAPMELLRSALPLLQQGTRPMVVNVSSVLSYRAIPRSSEYCASKFALRGLSDSLRAELAPRGIDVLVVCPSTTQSEFFDRLPERNLEMAWKDRPRMSAQRVARKTIRAIERGKHEIVLSAGGKLLVFATRRFPRLTDWIVARYF